VSGAANAEAARAGDVVLVVVPWDGHAELLRELAGPLAGKVVVDCVNPLGFDSKERLLSLHAASIEAEAEEEKELLIGDFVEDYDELVRDNLAPAAKKAGISASANVLSQGVISRGKDAVEVLLFVNVTVTEAKVRRTGGGNVESGRSARWVVASLSTPATRTASGSLRVMTRYSAQRRPSATGDHAVTGAAVSAQASVSIRIMTTLRAASLWTTCTPARPASWSSTAAHREPGTSSHSRSSSRAISTVSRSQSMRRSRICPTTGQAERRSRSTMADIGKSSTLSGLPTGTSSATMTGSPVVTPPRRRRGGRDLSHRRWTRVGPCVR